jgi:hypothetical protein
MFSSTSLHVRRRARSSCLPIALVVLAAGCSGGPRLAREVDTILDTPVEVDDQQQALTGVWADEEGKRVLLIQSGNVVAVQPLAGAAQQLLQFGEGVLDRESLRLVAYRQGVNTDSSRGGLDTTSAPKATMDRAGEVITFEDGRRWCRMESFPGRGELVGVWRTANGGRVAVAHEGESVLACALDEAARQDFTVATARVGADGRLWTVFVKGGRTGARQIGVPSANTIEWADGSSWRKDTLLHGAPPPPPEPVAPVEGAVLPNVVEGSLRWEFEWTDVAGASEYRLEIVQQDAARAFLSQSAIRESRYVLERSGGAPSRLEGWSWRVAAKVGGEWTAWSTRAPFRVAQR